MNSDSSTVKEESHNISPESRRVLTEIENMLGESGNSEKDVADTEEKKELKTEIEDEQIEAKVVDGEKLLGFIISKSFKI